MKVPTTVGFLIVLAAASIVGYVALQQGGDFEPTIMTVPPNDVASDVIDDLAIPEDWLTYIYETIRFKYPPSAEIYGHDAIGDKVPIDETDGGPTVSLGGSVIFVVHLPGGDDAREAALNHKPPPNLPITQGDLNGIPAHIVSFESGNRFYYIDGGSVVYLFTVPPLSISDLVLSTLEIIEPTSPTPPVL